MISRLAVPLHYTYVLIVSFLQAAQLHRELSYATLQTSVERHLPNACPNVLCGVPSVAPRRRGGRQRTTGRTPAVGPGSRSRTQTRNAGDGRASRIHNKDMARARSHPRVTRW